jgi:FkbH-like protein
MTIFLQRDKVRAMTATETLKTENRDASIGYFALLASSLPRAGRMRAVTWKHILRGLGLSVGAILTLLWGPIIVTVALGGLLRLIDLAPSQWLLAAPAVYVAWLVLLLLYFALETTLLAPLLVKPRRVAVNEGAPPPLAVSLVFLMYLRMRLLMTLPGVKMLQMLYMFDRLVFRAYAPRTHIGPWTHMLGEMLDPDLTFLGRGAFVGDGCRLMAHAAVRLRDGRFAYHTAPIRIGRNATIGGGTQIQLGATIGVGAVIEPCSHVMPFTRIPPGEVWGGSPAVFRRKRDDGEVIVTEERPAVEATEEILTVVALALGLPRDALSERSDANSCAAWDSLGQMALAAALHDHFGLKLAPDEEFALNSVADIVRALRRHAEETRAPAVDLPADPELFPLLEPAAATAAIGKLSLAPSARIEVCIAASFVAEPIAPTLRLWCRAFGIEAQTSFAGFNQVAATLLTPDSVFHCNRTGLNAVLVRPEDLGGAADARFAADQLLAAIESFAAGPLLVSDLPPIVSARVVADASLDAMRLHWRERLQPMPHVRVLSFAGIVEELGIGASRDEAMERAASAPYSPAVYQRLGIAVSRAARELRVAPKKVIVVDADGTLWGGVVGEDGAVALDTGGDYRRLQTALRALKDRGVLLALASRNEPQDVWAVFAAHPDMPLKREDFAACRIDWRPKSENVRALAQDLNLGLDALVFLDDNPAERVEVAARCPGVTVLPATDDPAVNVGMLQRLWCFDAPVATAEDGARTDYLRQEAERKAFAENAASLGDYLKSLQVKVEMRRARASDLPRVAQLTQKTNQFNLSLRRRSLAEIEALAHDHAIWIVSARDRFGDYGTVGVGITRADGATVALDTFLLSCRALGRGVEDAFLHGLCAVAAETEAMRLCAAAVEGPRNQPARDFFAARAQRTEDGAFEIDLTRPAGTPGHVAFTLTRSI